MQDYLSIGSVPSGEDCAQVGEEDYHVKAITECRRFLDLIKRTVGEPPEGAKLGIKGFEHDFGTYYEVVVYYDVDDEAATSYAYKVESEAPQNWD